MRIISGRFKGKKLLLPKDKNTRPLKDLVKESIFNLLEHSKKMIVRTGLAIAFPRSPMTVANMGWDLQSFGDGRFQLGLGTQVKAQTIHPTKLSETRFNIPRCQLKTLRHF